MTFEDEKDYLMRIIKEMVRVLFSLVFGKKYVSVEEESRNKYEVAGRGLNEFFSMVDSGQIDEAENQLLDGIDYNSREEIVAAALFYQYLSEKKEEFLKKHDFSREEVLEGLKNIVDRAGYGNVMDIVESI